MVNYVFHQGGNTYGLQFELWKKQLLSDGQTAWVHVFDGDKQCLTRIGVECSLPQCMQLIPEGLVLEFGVASGKSALELASSGRKLYGFDWWGGLPHNWNDSDRRGYLKCEKPVLPGNIELIEGLFSDTLEDFLLAHSGPVALVHVDCDLFCSALYVLNCLKGRFIKGSIIAFDEIDVEFALGELQAWTRYLHENPEQNWQLLGKQHQFGEVYRLA
jgi:hypothetical protein